MKKQILFLLLAIAGAVLMAACASPSARRAGQASAQPQKDTTVRVLLAEKQKSATFKHSGLLYIYTSDRSKKYKISRAGALSARALGGGKVQAGTLQSAQPIVLEPAPGKTITFNGNAYAGKIYLIPQGSVFHIVEYVPLETYLYGVLPYEMSYTWPAEALKAQAVAARTFTLKSMETTGKRYFDLYNDVRSQMYKGTGKVYPSVKTAVDKTRGQVLAYEGKLFYTYYHGNCGGATDSVTSWNPGAKAIKPLSGAKCGYDKHAKNYNWQQTVSRQKAESYAASLGLKGKLKSIKIARKTGTGRATNITVRTKKGSKTVPCGNFRMAFGLKSCKITKLSLRKKDVLFKGRGSGHGVGMCQDGANGMAKAGKDYKQILKRYYPGAKITPIKDL